LIFLAIIRLLISGSQVRAPVPHQAKTLLQ
jgi:hypothetical protein